MLNQVQHDGLPVIYDSCHPELVSGSLSFGWKQVSGRTRGGTFSQKATEFSPRLSKSWQLPFCHLERSREVSC